MSTHNSIGMARILASALSMILIGSSATEAEDTIASIPEPLSLSWCLDRAREANPSLARANAMAAAAAHRIRPAGSLDDPRFTYDMSNIPTGDFDFNSTALSGHQLGLRQKLPVPGLLGKRLNAAKSGAEAVQLLAEHQQILIDAAVESAWAELAFAQRAIGITNRNIALLRQLASTAESRYRVGNGLQQDVLRAQVELTALLRERLGRDEAIANAEATLIALLDLPGESQLPMTDALQSSRDLPGLPPILERLGTNHARLRSSEKRVDEARLRIRVAELEGLPDFDIGVGYRVRTNVAGDPVNGDDFISAGVTIRLPVDRSKWRPRVAERRAMLRGAKAELRGIRANLIAQTRAAHAALVRARSEESLLATGLVPQARQSLAASRSAYEVGRIEFLSLLDSQVRLLGAELRLVRARADIRLAYAALEIASGEKLR